MKVFAINGSPAGDSGNTAVVLNPFLLGMKKAGAKAPEYNIREMFADNLRQKNRRAK